jgi:hypothetical protein
LWYLALRRSEFWLHMECEIKSDSGILTMSCDVDRAADKRSVRNGVERRDVCITRFKVSKPSTHGATTTECSLTRIGYGVPKECERKDKNAAIATFEQIGSIDAQTENCIVST